MEIRTVTCPKCGKSFDVNSSITNVTCNYCGTAFVLSPPSGPFSAQGGDGEQGAGSAFYFDKAVAALTKRVTAHDAGNVLTKQKYPQSFRDYYRAARGPLEYFDKAYGLFAGDKKKIIEKFAQEFSAKVKKNAGTADFNLLKGMKLEDVIYLYIAFAVPSVLKYGAEYSDALADAILATFNSEHKKRKIGKSTFENINKGFKFKLCFITTAVCNTLGRPDDCYELLSFRRFRDEYLLKQPGGEGQVREYYMVAPLIVDAIDSSGEKESVYRDIFVRYLKKCLAMYEKHEYERCREIYTDMVGDLRERWL